jgi:tRNA threonylcarbamoyladenosine biosynthesis protein TsaE
LASPGLVVLLAGELGAGKTCFAQGVAEGLGTPAGNPVTSPSYTLLNVHKGRLPLYHFDLYRLATVGDLEDLGYDEIAEGDGVTLVEWADRLSAPLAASLRVVLHRVDSTRRKLCFEAGDAVGRKLIAALAEAANTL